MHRRSRLALGLAVLVALGGCGTSSDQQVVDEGNAFPETSTSNGTVPPGTPRLLISSEKLVDEVRNGQQVTVYRDVRGAGTRSPIHIHPFGGWVCVVSGRAVLYMEGSEPEKAGPGDCVHMPAMTPMSNLNPGPGPAMFLDSFVSPPDTALYRNIEVGRVDLGNEFSSDHM